MRAFSGFALFCALATLSFAAPDLRPDLVVAADGSGDFKTIQAAVASIPKDNRERKIVFVKNGVYPEKVRVDASFVTLRGESREGTKIEFNQGNEEYRGANRDNLGAAVLNINGDDFVLQNITVHNTYPTMGKHAFAVYGRGDRTVLEDADILSLGNDTISLWRTGAGQFSEDAGQHASPNGRYYHARLKVCGSVDFICPRGWCYMVDSEVTEVNPHTDAAMWHDGSRDQDMKFVMRGCTFVGPEGDDSTFRLARHHHDGEFFFIDCKFDRKMRDNAPYRVMYPLNGGPATPADTKKNKDADPTNIWGERAYYYNDHRTGGDYAWFRDNLNAAPGAPRPTDITAKWTFGGKWDPENEHGPAVKTVAADPADASKVVVTFAENVTVKGHPRLALGGGVFADYASGSGTTTLVFNAPAGKKASRIDLNGGAIVANEASAKLRFADTKLP